jgi:hypothetical protein
MNQFKRKMMIAYLYQTEPSSDYTPIFEAMDDAVIKGLYNNRKSEIGKLVLDMKKKNILALLQAENQQLKARLASIEMNQHLNEMLMFTKITAPLMVAAGTVIQSMEEWGEKVFKALEDERYIVDLLLDESFTIPDLLMEQVKELRQKRKEGLI